MKSKFASFIMSMVIILIIAVIGVFGIIIFEEMQLNIQTSAQPDKFEGEIEDNFVQENIEQENIKTPEIIENPFNKIEKVEDTNNKINYDNVYIDKYFYNQLDDTSKIIYKVLEQNKENMKTGTYRVEFGDNFSDLLKTSNGQDELGKYYQSAIEAYTYDNPSIFYLSPNKMYLNIETTTKMSIVTYNVFIDNGTQNNYFYDEYASKAQVDDAISAVENIKNKILQNRTGNTYKDIKMVHDYLIDNVKYDTTVSKPHIYNAYGALVKGEAVCEGYARAFKYLMDELNIPCTLVIGKGTNNQGKTENHAWNYVELNGNWYAVDCTWDDPVITGESRLG